MTAFEVAVLCLMLLFCVTNMGARAEVREGGAYPLWYLLAVLFLAGATVCSLVNALVRIFQ